MFVCLFVCVFVQFFDPLPVVQGRHQGYVWIAYNLTRKMKLFWTRLKQKDKFRTWCHLYRKHLFVCHRCLSVQNNCLFVRHTQGYQVEEVKLDCYFFIPKVSYICDRQTNILTGNGKQSKSSIQIFFCQIMRLWISVRLLNSLWFLLKVIRSNSSRNF